MAAGYGCSDSTADDSLVDLIVDEVLKSAGIPKSSNAGKPRNSVPLGVSNRHMHIREDTFKRLFGKDASLGVYRDLYQPGEFASDKTVTIVGPKMRAIQNVRILGPFRNYDQVELSLTDAVGIGISPPVRNSGDLKGSAPLTVAGPAGSVFIPECAIIANRHVHIPSAQASLWKVSEGDFIKMRIGGEKSTVFENVLVRINDSWKPQLHLDTDDANAANVRCNTLAEFEGKM
ncbi:phosphate propanoyltransferase [bacterium]|nr:phosphate propanoyltransferase [bacterium]